MRTVVAALILMLSVATAGCNGAPEYDGPVRHVVLLSLDTTRADHFGFYGNTEVKTPHLDRLAAQSIVLDDYMTVVPTTLSSHVSLFSGKYPHSHGTPRNGFTVNDDNVMLAELLRDQGFATAGFVASFPLEHRFGIAQGFEHYDDRFDVLAQQVPMQDERSAAAVTDAVIEYLDGRDEAGNLFLFAHYFDPHAPYAAPAPYDTLYDSRGGEDLPPWAEALGLCREGGSPELFERIAAQYAGEISYMDEHIGRLLDALRERGILDEAILIVTSDHGELFTEHPDTTCFDHGWMTYQQDVRAVGMIRLPGGEKGGMRVLGTLANIDILPTLLGYLGIDLPQGVDGAVIDFEQPEAATGVRFSQATKPASRKIEAGSRWRNSKKARCVRDGRYKFVQVPYARQAALYDLRQDPAEQTNLLLNPTKEARDLAEKLRAKLEAWSASANPLPSEFTATQREEVRKRLEAIGYVEEP